jgi:hypothetical protein
MGIEGSEKGHETPQNRAFGDEGEGSAASVDDLSRGCEDARGLFDPDVALKEAIKAAIDAGLYDRARALLDVLAKTSEAAGVVDLRERSKR